MDRIVIMGTNNKSFSVIYNGEVVNRSILQIQDDLRLLKKGKAQRVRIRDKDLLIYYKGGIVTLKSYRELGHNCPATRDYISHVKKYIKLSTKAKHVGALVVASSIALGVASFKSNKVQAENNDMKVTSTKDTEKTEDSVEQQEAVTSTYTDKAELNLEYESRAYTDRNLLVRNNEEAMAAIKKYANKYMID